jgi:hypothetical protein
MLKRVTTTRAINPASHERFSFIPLLVPGRRSGYGR